MLKRFSDVTRPFFVSVLLISLFPLPSFSAESLLQRCQSSESFQARIDACTSLILSNARRPVLEKALNSRGKARLALGQGGSALADFDQLIRLNPKIAGYYDNRRAVYQSLNRPADALRDANAAVGLAPNHAFVYHSRAGLLRGMGDLNAAVRDYSTAIGLAPEHAKHAFRWYDRGTIYYELGNLRLAVEDLSKVLRLNPAFGFAHKFLGMALVKTGEVEKGRSELESYLKLDPNDEEARVFLAKSTSEAAGRKPDSVSNAGAPQRKVALVIGNGNYVHAAQLRNPERDASAIATTLRASGFQSVALETNLSRERMISVLREFARTADSSDWAAVYYSGHGVELNGINYLIPIDAELRLDRDADLEAVDLGKILSAVEGAKRLRLVILDACRDNPFISRMRSTGATRSIGRGLARVEPEAGTLIVYAAKHGQVAFDGDGPNSPFVSAFLPRLKTPNVEIRRLFDLVRDDVMVATNGKQQPFSYGSLSGSADFFFVKN